MRRPRAENFSPEEKSFFIDLVERFKGVIQAENKKSDKVTNQQKTKAWMDIVLLLNNEFPLRKRTVDQVKLLWFNMKRKTKTACAARRRDLFKTGGGPAVQNLSEENERIVSMVPQQVHPLDNEYDNDALVIACDVNETGSIPSSSLLGKEDTCTISGDDSEASSSVGHHIVKDDERNTEKRILSKQRHTRLDVYSTYSDNAAEYHNLRMKKMQREMEMMEQVHVETMEILQLKKQLLKKKLMSFD